MKKTLLLVIATMVMGAVCAQNEMAILNHNDNLSVFYGTTALKSALDSAVRGDVITLSSGNFSCYSFKSGITVNGNGFEEDLVAGGQMPTVVTYSGTSSYGYLEIHDTVALSGLKINSQARVFGSDVQLTKCYFYDLVHENGGRTTIVSCFIDRMSSCSNDAVISNSIINQFGSTGARTQVMNSIVWSSINYGVTNGTYCTMYNCIVMMNYNGVSQAGCYNCIGINTSTNTDFFTGAINYLQFQGMTQAQKDSVLAVTEMSHGNYNASNYAEVFQTYRGSSYTPRLDFSLTESFDTLIAELGVYHGMMPYTPFVNRPRYVRTNAAPRTTLDGKLSVDIQVVTTEE